MSSKIRSEVSFGDSFDKLMGWLFPVYLGVKVERTESGFKVFDKPYTTWEEATKAVDEHFEIINKSIK